MLKIRTIIIILLLSSFQLLAAEDTELKAIKQPLIIILMDIIVVMSNY